MPDTMLDLCDQFHSLISRAIDAEGVFPHQLLAIKPGGSMLAASIDIREPLQACAAIAALMRRHKAVQLCFGTDRYTKAGQGTTLGDLVASAWWNGTAWKPFVIEYQHEPRIVQPIAWDNAWWNRLILEEIRDCIEPYLRRSREQP